MAVIPNTYKYTLRPFVGGQHARWLSRCTFIDGYLYVTDDRKFYFIIEIRERGQMDKADIVLAYWLDNNIFGLFDAVMLQVKPNNLGVQTNVSHLKYLSLIQRSAMRALMVQLVGQVKYRLAPPPKPQRFSVKLHCLLARGCDPLEGVRNHYETSGRGARDRKARASGDKREIDKLIAHKMAMRYYRAKRNLELTRESMTDEHIAEAEQELADFRIKLDKLRGKRTIQDILNGLDKPQNALIEKSD